MNFLANQIFHQIFVLKSYIGPPSYRGSDKITVCLSVCLSSVYLSVWHFSQELLISFFLIFDMMVDNWNI